MLFYKVVLQKKINSIPLYKKIEREDFLVGNINSSFAIPYSPEIFNSWLNQSKIFALFVNDIITQALLTNSKFSFLLLFCNELKFKLVDCKFDNIELDDVLEGEELNEENLQYIIDSTELRLMKLTFRTKNNFIVAIKRNGVLEIDEEVLHEDILEVRYLLDFLNFGPGVKL